MEKVEKRVFTKLTQKRGISLITLVITIIVIIILAAAIVMSLNNNNIITNASSARYESDRDYIQSVLELAIQKVVLRHKGKIELEAGPINETAKDIKLVDGKVTWLSDELGGLSGEIIFDEGEDTDTKFYVGEKLPIYGSETTWFVDEQGRVLLQIANKIFGGDDVPKGNIKASQIMENPSEYYGKTVKYGSEIGVNYEWQIFHADEGGIYLITKDYIKREDIPFTCKNGVETVNKPEYGRDEYGIRTAQFENILDDYANGSADIKESMKSLNSSYFIDKGYTSTNENMKAVAYMLDTNAWRKYGDNRANYAIGGPSIELLCKSYNAYKGEEVLTCEATSDVGYMISKNGSELNYFIEGFSESEANGMYYISTFGNAYANWIASPSAYDNSCTMGMGYDENINANGVSIIPYNWNAYVGFRPVVYIKSSVGLEELEDGTFKVSGADTNDKLEVITNSKIQSNPSKYYGRTVKYESEKGKNYEWQIFHADAGGIYIITKEHIKREDIPNSWKNGVETSNKPNNGTSSHESAYFTGILSDYENGSDDIKENIKNLNSSYFIDKGYTSTNENMKAVAYMLDTDAWSKYSDEKANYAIGGPSLELLCKSYNTYKRSEILKCEATSVIGYKISENGNEMTNSVDIFYRSDANGAYETGWSNAEGYWLASPSAINSDCVIFVGDHGLVYNARYDIQGTYLGLRPLVYLKSSVKLVELENGTFLVK